MAGGRSHSKMLPEWCAARQALRSVIIAAAVAGSGSLLMASPGITEATGFGTGFFLTSDGHVVTNYHVIDDVDEVRVRIAERDIVKASVVKTLENHDLAILKITVDRETPYLSLGDSYSVKLGDPVFTIGFPQPRLQGFSPKLSSGEISGMKGFQDDANQFQISNPVQAGNSGGALLTEKGEIVGVVIALLKGGENVAYAVKASKLAALAEIADKLSGQVREQKRKTYATRRKAIAAAQSATVQILTFTDLPDGAASERTNATSSQESKGSEVRYNVRLQNKKTKALHEGYAILGWKNGKAYGGYWLENSPTKYFLTGVRNANAELVVQEITENAVSATGKLSMKIHNGKAVWSGALYNTKDKRSFNIWLTERNPE